VSASERSEEPCELPGLAQRPFAGRVLRSKTAALGWKPQSVEDPPWRLLRDDGHLFAHEASLGISDNLRIVIHFPIGLIHRLLELAKKVQFRSIRIPLLFSAIKLADHRPRNPWLMVFNIRYGDVNIPSICIVTIQQSTCLNSRNLNVAEVNHQQPDCA
jgi:hypothetical protein